MLKRLSPLPFPEKKICELWLMDFSAIDGEELVGRESNLNAFELARYHKYATSDLKAKFLLSRLLMKTLLSKLLQCSMDDLDIEYTPLGKPYLTGKHSHCHFSYSHSRDKGIFVLSMSHEVGIDLEYIDQKNEIVDTLPMFSSAEEKSWVLAENALFRYYLLWTLKEAYLKRQGTGLSAPFPELHAIFSEPLDKLYAFPPDNNILMYSNQIGDYIYSLSMCSM